MEGFVRRAVPHASPLAPPHAPPPAVARAPLQPATWAARPVRPASVNAPQREARLDALFVRALGANRAQWLQALATEPPGPARHLRAYVRSVCDQALRPRTRPSSLLQVLVQPQYQAIWCDFVAEACAGDSVDHDLSMQCRAAVEGLWFRQATLHAGVRNEVVAQGTPQGTAQGALHGPADRLPALSPLSTAAQAATVAAVRDYLLALCTAAAQTPPAPHCTQLRCPPTPRRTE